MDLNENQMSRGLNQALYKYLPSSWIDYYRRTDRTSFTAYVKHWNSSRIDNINDIRLLQQVDKKVKEYKQKGVIKDFILPICKENYDVLTPKRGVNADIIAEINPLTFYCGRCMMVYGFKSAIALQKQNPYLKCKNNKCQGNLRQINLVYICKCGWADGVTPSKCKDKNCNSGPENPMKFRPPFQFVCTKHPNIILEMEKYCPECNKKIWPKNALDMGNQIPFSLTMVDLLEIKEQNFLFDNPDAKKIIISYWLEKLDRNKFKEFIKKGFQKPSNEFVDNKIQEVAKEFTQKFKIEQEQAMEMARDSLNIINEADIWVDSMQNVDCIIHNTNESYLGDIAVQILEYDSILYPKNYISLENAQATSLKQNTSISDYKQVTSKFGFTKAQASSNVPFIISVYGFTRKDTKPSEAVLRGLVAESNNKKNIYAMKIETEGILFELDRKKIIEWLLINNFINKNDYDVPDVDEENAMKAWFINYVNTNEIETFTPIAERNITYYVYNLIHTITHSLIRSAAQLCGLDKNSLSEYIFPNIPAFFIYCQNSQGFNIGALSNLFEAHYDRWLKATIDSIEKCIFDPICVDVDHACSGCIFLNEISCTHFNKDLDRRFLIGWQDKSSEDRIIGFWEDFD